MILRIEGTESGDRQFLFVDGDDDDECASASVRVGEEWRVGDGKEIGIFKSRQN